MLLVLCPDPPISAALGVLHHHAAQYNTSSHSSAVEIGGSGHKTITLSVYLLKLK